VGMDNGLFANPAAERVVSEVGVLLLESRLEMERTLDAILAFWIALRIEVLYPPETSVPKPTFGSDE